jgi:hypothetical protein
MGITYDSSTVPSFSAYLLPEDERENGQHVNDELSSLASITDEVASAVQLFNYSNAFWSRSDAAYRADWHNKELETKAYTIRQWPFIAAQSVAISIHHFGLLRGAINAIWRKVPTIAALVNRDDIRRSGKLFSKYFPRTEMLRDAVCHSAELSKTPESVTDHATSDPGKPRFFIRASLAGTHLQYTKDGKLWELDISQDTVTKLVDVRDIYFSGFRAIEPELLRRAKEAWELRAATRAGKTS